MKTVDLVKSLHMSDQTAKLKAANATMDDCRYAKHNLQKKLSKLRKHRDEGRWNDDRDHRYMVIEYHIEAINRYMKGLQNV